jgi:IS30 family transposase
MARTRSWEERQVAFRGLTRGRSAKSLAAELGVDHTVIGDWARLAGMDLVEGRAGGVVPVNMDAEPPRDQGRAYQRLTLAQRSFIQAALSLPEPLSLRRIAVEIGVSASTVSREVRGHRIPFWRMGDRYDADIAHYHALRARPRSRPGKLDHPPLRARVVSGLNDKQSPEQIDGRLKLEFPDRPEMHVSHETIYQALYVQGAGGLRHELKVEKALRSGRKTRSPQSKLPARSSRPWLDGARLSDRPAEAADRAVPGHWEGDLVVGPDNSGIVTLVERRSRFVLLGRLPGCRDSATVNEVMQQMIARLPEALFTTITWDQGTEMAQHATFTIATGCPVYFCDPHSPWQRPTNENTNGLIRDFYPKGTNFNTIADEELLETEQLLNTRPRKVLDFYTPSERLNQELNCVALAT